MEIKYVVKIYPSKRGEEVKALKGVSFSLPETGMVFLLGKSGSGKTTLLNLLAGLDAPTEGEISFRGEKISSLSAEQGDEYRNSVCSFVFQEYNLIPELNVYENVSLALELQGEQNKDKVLNALKEVGLEGYGERKISTLSGGQKQRVAIARAIVKDDGIILADEPTGALDSETGESVLRLLKRLSEKRLIVVVTHDREFAESFGDRILELKDGEIVRDSAPYFPAEDEAKPPFRKSRAKLPLPAALKIGCASFRYHPIRLAVTLLICIIASVMFGAFYPFSHLSESEAAALTAENAGLRHSLFMKTNLQTGYAEPFTANDEALVAEKGIPALRLISAEIEDFSNVSSSEPIYYRISPSFAAVADKETMTAFGLTVRGTPAAKETEIMLSDFTADQLSSLRGLESAENMIGQTISVDGEEYTVTAIVETGFDFEAFSALKEQTASSDLSRTFYNQTIYTHKLFYLPEAALTEDMEISCLLLNLESLSVRELETVYSFTEGDYEYSITDDFFSPLRALFSVINEYSGFLIWTAAALGAFAAALLFYFIELSVSDCAEMIGVLKSLGAGNGDLGKIFLWEGIFMGAAVAAVSLVLSAVLCTLLSNALAAMSGMTFLLFRYRVTDGLFLVLAIFAAALLGGAVPLWRFSRSSPLKLMRRL